MFTGIITDVGHVRSLEKKDDVRIEIATAYETDSIAIGASIAVSGVCLTVVDKGSGWFSVDASTETFSCTALGTWTEGTAVNLERSLKVGDELGGHIVTGHVDAVGEILDVVQQEGSQRFRISLPAELAPYVAKKGSLAVNGVSLTVNDVIDTPNAAFSVNLIPHSLKETAFHSAKAGDRVNLEIDILARYLARMTGFTR